MGIENRKDIRIMFFICSGIFLACVPFFVAELFYPQLLGVQGIPYLIFSAFLTIESTMMFVMGLRFRKLDTYRLARGLSIYEFTVNPIFMISTIFLAVFLPRGELTWLYYVNMGLLFILLLIRLSSTFHMTGLMKKGEPALYGFRNHSIIACAFLLIAFTFYVFSAIKKNGLDFAEIARKGMEALTEAYIWLTILEILISMFLLAFSLFVTLCSHFTAKEKVIMDFKTNFAATKEQFFKNDITFWTGILVTVFLWILSFISMTRLFSAYFSLFFLYSIILLIRIPGFIRKKSIERRYGNKPYLTFIKKHWVFIYSAILLIVYSIICIIFGDDNLAQIETEATNNRELITLGIFVPWAIFKLVLGARTYKVAKESTLEPLAILNAYLDLLLSIYTLAKSVFIISGYTRFEAVRVIGIVLGTLLSVFSLYCSIRLLIIGILGVRGMRAFPYESLRDTVRGIRKKRRGVWTKVEGDTTVVEPLSGPDAYQGEEEDKGKTG